MVSTDMATAGAEVDMAGDGAGAGIAVTGAAVVLADLADVGAGADMVVTGAGTDMVADGAGADMAEGGGEPAVVVASIAPALCRPGRRAMRMRRMCCESGGAAILCRRFRLNAAPSRYTWPWMAGEAPCDYDFVR